MNNHLLAQILYFMAVLWIIIATKEVRKPGWSGKVLGLLYAFGASVFLLTATLRLIK